MQLPHTRLPYLLSPPIPAAPATILYDQTDNPAPTPPPPPSNGVVTSQDYDPEFDNYDSFAADDFVVPEGQIWNITEVDVIGEFSEPLTSFRAPLLACLWTMCS